MNNNDYYGVIYKITNCFNNKVYIGQTVQTLNARLNDHKRQAKSGKSTKLYNAIRKYGIDNFSISMIDTANDQTDLNNKEIYWIDYYNACEEGYNIQSGGHISPENAKKFRINVAERMRNVKYWLGKKHSIESKEKMSKAKLGKKQSEESIQKASEARKKNGYSGVALLKGKDHLKCIPVVKLDINGNYIKEYNYIGEAAIDSDISIQSIYNCLKDITLSAKNTRWIKLDDYYDGMILPPVKPPKQKLHKNILQIDLVGNVVYKFKGISEAEQLTGISYKNIFKCLNKNATAGGYRWVDAELGITDILNTVIN